MADAVADRLGDGLRLLVDLLEHERLVAALLGALVVPVELDRVVLDPGAVRTGEDRALGVIVTMSPSSGNCTWRVSFRNAPRSSARNISPLPIPTTSGVWCRAATRTSAVVVDDDEGEVPFELANVRWTAQEIAVVVALDQVGHGLRVGLGGERVPIGEQASRSSR